jgi:cell division protein FtsB
MAGTTNTAQDQRAALKKATTRWRALIVVATLALCIALAAVILYPVARDYYIALRSNDRLMAELEAVENRNSQIQSQIDALSTPEGIEDRAREEFGWVKEGEQAVNITGLDVSNSSTALPENIQQGTIAAEGTWVTEFLDTFFDVDTHSTPAQATPAPQEP